MAIRIPATTRPPRGLPAASFWALALGCLLFAYLSLDDRYLRDYWQHLASARAAAEAGEALARRDALTFTMPGEPLVNSDWLAQRIFLSLHEAGGLVLARTLNALLIVSAFAALGWAALRRSGSPGAALASTAAALACALQSLTLRPQTFSLALACAAIAVLEMARGRPRVRWALVPLMALWGNLHGAFPIGWALIGLDRWERRRAARAGGAPQAWGEGLAADAAALAAPLAHPQAGDLLAHLARNAWRSRARRISEWMPPSPGEPVGVLFLLAAAGTLALAWIGRRRGEWGLLGAGGGLRAAVLGLAAAWSARMVAWFGAGMAPAWAAALARLRVPVPSATRRVPAALAAVPILLALGALPWGGGIARRLADPPAHPRRAGPEAAIDWLAEGEARGNVWAPFDWAGYLEWRCFGRVRVFADGRVDLYPDRIWSDYLAVESGDPRALAILGDAGVRWVLVDRRRSPVLDSLLRGARGWEIAREDAGAALFRRAEGPR